MKIQVSNGARTALYIFTLFWVFGCTFENTESSLILPDPGNGGILLPEHFGAVVVADNLGRGRHLAVRENGDIYVHLRKLTDDGNAIIALRDTTGDGKADIIRGFSKFPGTGIKLHKGYLYYSTRTRVYRSPMIDDALLPDTRIDTLVRMVDGSGHMEKTFTFDGKGNIYVNIGSMSNACQEEQRSKASKGIEPCPELGTRAGIWKFDDHTPNQQQDVSLRYATGIRNAVALSWNSEVDKLFALQHGRDDLHRFWPDLYTEEQNLELPAEEFLEVEEGDDFGWPYCYWDQFKKKKLLSPEYGGDGETQGRCAEIKPPVYTFPGHWAPNGLLFYKGDMFPKRYKNGAFIAWHGSWNRLGHEQAGFNVVFLPMKNGIPTGAYEIFADGFKGLRPIKNTGDAKYRPCGLAEGPDGSLYVVDSQMGRVWRIMYFQGGVIKSADQMPVVPEEAFPDEETVPAALLPGKRVYDAYCTACHMSNGKGVSGMNPPLSGTEWVLGDPDRIIRIVLQGLSDPVEINGETYQNIMASHAFLSDQQIADVLTYVRQSFGNNAGRITRKEVTEMRQKMK